MSNSVSSEDKVKVSLEGLSALRAVALGDPYLKSRGGAQRAGRTCSLRRLMEKGLVDHDGSLHGFVLTDLGKRILEARKHD